MKLQNQTSAFSVAEKNAIFQRGVPPLWRGRRRGVGEVWGWPFGVEVGKSTKNRDISEIANSLDSWKIKEGYCKSQISTIFQKDNYMKNREISEIAISLDSGKINGGYCTSQISAI